MQSGNFDINELKRRMQGAIARAASTNSAACAPAAPRPRCSSRCRSTPMARHMPLNQVATVSVPEPRLMSVQVWDKSMVKAVEKAIVDSNLGLSPATEGQVIRLRIPELNEERRKELVKVAHKYAEAARVAVRHVRRDGLDIAQEAREGPRDYRGRSEASDRRGAEGDRRDDRRDRPVLATKEKEILTV